MRYIFFTKMAKGLDLPHLIEALHRIGVEGADLCVREGYPVTPANARQELAPAVKQFRDAGLSVPLVTAPTSLIDPAAREAEDLFAACHDAGVEHIKLGYWVFKGSGYWPQVDAARKSLEGFDSLASRFGVKGCVHTHSGPYLGVNASSLMHLLRGFNPANIAAYLDPGHLNLHGEPLPMAFDIAGERLALIAIKDSYWQRGEGGKPKQSHFVPLGEGTVDWREMMRLLHARDFQGPLTFHSEYEGWPVEQILDQTRKDVAYMRNIEKEAKAG